MLPTIRCILAPVVALLTTLPAIAQSSAPEPARPIEQKATPGESKPITAPTGKLIFDQLFRKVGDPDTPGSGESIGTGFFARTGSGEVVAITSIHFLELEGKPYDSITWIDAEGNEVARSTTSYGTPGNQPDWDAEVLNLRKDYLILKLDAPPKDVEVLELDTRDKPEARSKSSNEEGESILFPFPAKNAAGHRMIAGDVSITKNSKTTVMLKNATDLEFSGTSGSPVLSQKTGKVIGILSTGGNRLGFVSIQLAPISNISKAIAKAEKDKNFPKLRDINWSKHGPIKEEPKPAEKKGP